MAVAIFTGQAPAAAGPYSQAVRVGSAIYLAGQIGLCPATGRIVEGGVEAEAEQIFRNLTAVLAAAEASLDDAVSVSVFLTDANDFALVNDIYAMHLSGPTLPARTTVVVKELPLGAQLEISLVAHSSGGKARYARDTA